MDNQNHQPSCINLIAEAIFVCEFHDIVGNAIVYCYPEDELKKDFDQIQDFVIPKDELCGKLIITRNLKNIFHNQRIQVALLCSWITNFIKKQRKSKKTLQNFVNFHKNKIIMNQEKIYSREKYIFNICIMVRKEQYLSRKFWYQEITRKLAFFFTSLEVKLTLLRIIFYKEMIINRQKLTLYIRMIKQLSQKKFKIYTSHQIKRKNAYQNTMKSNSIKPQGVEDNVVEIKDYLVPLPLFSSKALDGVLEQFDSELYKVYKEINGEKCVKKISRDLNKDLQKLKICLKNLYYHNMIKFVDIFRLNNHYQVTSKIHDFMQNQQLQQLCIRYIIVNQERKIDPSEIIYLYLQFQKQKSVQDIVLENRHRFEKINLVQFVHFGIIHELIERVHLYILANREIDLFNEKNIQQLLNDEEYKPSKKVNHMKLNQNQNLIQIKNTEFKDFVRRNSPLDQILVEFQITEEQFRSIQDITNMQLIYR